MMKQTLKVVESGTIDLEFNDQQQVLLQFNCSCQDAMPYCRAMCCRHRPFYNVALEPAELPKFDKTIQHPVDKSVQLLAYIGSSCAYLNNDCKCSVHHDKPIYCQKWHCSPGGVGDGIEIKDDGWLLLPSKGDAQHTEMYLNEIKSNNRVPI